MLYKTIVLGRVKGAERFSDRGDERARTNGTRRRWTGGGRRRKDRRSRFGEGQTPGALGIKWSGSAGIAISFTFSHRTMDSRVVSIRLVKTHHFHDKFKPNACCD